MRPLVYLFGGYRRACPPVGHMLFLRRRAADNYRNTFFGAIDPYARNMGPTEPVPGRLSRKELR